MAAPAMAALPLVPAPSLRLLTPEESQFVRIRLCNALYSSTALFFYGQSCCRAPPSCQAFLPADPIPPFLVFRFIIDQLLFSY